MEPIKIGGIEKFSVVDFPNQIASVIFMQGCPWRCPFCYNSSLQEIGKPTELSWQAILELFQKRKGIIDAVVFSGGEPLTQDGLFLAMEDVISLGYKVGLHTGGYRPQALKKVIDKVYWVGLDIKAPLEDDDYSQAVGCCQSSKKVIESLDILLQSGKDFECRTTCDPRLLTIEDIYKIGKFLKDKGVKSYHLQKYRPIPNDNTPDSECEKFFQDKELIEFLKRSFTDFDLRK